MGNNEIKVTNKSLIESRHKCEYEPYEYNKYKITEAEEENKCQVAL